MLKLFVKESVANQYSQNVVLAVDFDFSFDCFKDEIVGMDAPIAMQLITVFPYVNASGTNA